MKAKDELKKIPIYDAQINEKIEELARLKSLATKVTTVLSGETVSRSRSTDQMSASVIKIVELQEEISNLIDLYCEKKRYFSRIIDKLEKPEQIKVLYGYYFHGKSFEDMAHDLGYTRRNICYIHGAALQGVEAIIAKEKVEGCERNEGYQNS